MIRKTVVILILLVAVAGCQVTMMPTDPQAVKKAETKKAEADTLERIRTYRIIQQEQQLIRDILLLKAEIAKLQPENPAPKQGNRPPGTIDSMEYIPMNEIPKDAKVQDGLGK